MKLLFSPPSPSFLLFHEESRFGLWRKREFFDSLLWSCIDLCSRFLVLWMCPYRRVSEERGGAWEN
jgi:hypothetical protein